MPSGQPHPEHERPLMHSYHHPVAHDFHHDPAAASILQSVKEQEAHFEQLTRELEAERQSVANQLERYKLREENAPAYGSDDAYHSWRPSPLEASIPEEAELNAKMADTHLLINRKIESTEEKKVIRTEKVETIQRHYYADRSADMHHYIPYTEAYYTQEGAPHVQEYSMSYHTSTNGHHGDGDASPNSSQLSMPVENATLISRNTAQTKTQQVKTVTKVITTREIRHIGPDGQPIDYPAYSSVPPPPSTADYVTYTYNAAPDAARDYGTYDSGRPPSPAGQAPPRGYPPHDLYGTYGRAPSPGSGRSYDMYPPRAVPAYPEYDYHGYPTQAPTPPSAASESPPMRRAMPQAPRTPGNEYNHQPTAYDDIDHPTLIPQRLDHQERYRATPSPAPGSDRYGPYGYTGAPVPATSPGYNPYEAAPPPQGYLDRRPSYDDHPQSQAPHARPPSAYAHPPRLVFEDDEGPPPQIPDSQLPPPPHPHLDFDQIDGENRDVRWRDPDLHEVIEFLGHPNNVVRANAAAYLQHLCYMDDNMKQKTRSLGGIPPLIDLLNQEIPEIQRNACGALRNLSYGRQNDDNKRAIRNAGGIPALVRLLRKTPDNEIRELVTGILWNLSSSDDLKRPIIDDALAVLVNHVIIPLSGWDRNQDSSEQLKTQEIYWSTVFRNASGVLRNVSSAGEYARRKLRECEGLVESLLHLVRAAIGKNDMDNKSVENCVCILRNLSYRCQEVEDPEYDKHVMPQPQTRAAAAALKVGDNLGCFGASKKKKEAQTAEKQKKESTVSSTSPRSRAEPVHGMELLWQPSVVQPYIALLSECSNPETLEAAAGAIQNLAACYWQPSIDIRAAVRKEKGLPFLVELLRMEVDRVVCAVATALRNLAMDPRNKELIGKYGMRDLVDKLPNGNPQHDAGTSHDTIAAVLATLNEVIVKNSDFARSLLEAGGVERLTYITKQKGKFSSRVIKFTSQLLFNMWQHVELREVYRKAGWKESHFITRTMVARNATSPNASANNTLSRPISTQGGTKYEDRTLPRGQELNSTGLPDLLGSSKIGAVPYSRSEELPLNELSPGPEQPPPQPMSVPAPLHRPPVGGVPIFPPAPHTRNEPVYAQVNRDKKKSRQPDSSSQSILLDHQGSPQAGDSWV